jgi:hypothetical protein
MRISASRFALALALCFAQVAKAQDPVADCATLAATLGLLPGYELTAPAAGPRGGWCVMDGATLRSTRPGWPNLSAEQLRLRRGGPEELPWIELTLTGLRITPRVGDTSFDDRLRALFRLQRIDFWLVALHDQSAEKLIVKVPKMRLSGGTVLSFEADIAGGSLEPSSVFAGAVTRLVLDWRNDGRLLRPVMELVGENITSGRGVAGVAGGAAVDATREALADLVASLPDAALADGARYQLRQAVAALPQGRGRLVVQIEAPDGIGAARLALVALSRNPLGPGSLTRFLAGASIQANWQPGIAP